MEKPTHEQVNDLVGSVVLPFYDVYRDTLIPTKPRGERRFENDAEHSWALAVLACSLAPHIDSTLDVGKVSQFAVVHDLVEVYSGDTSVWADDKTLAAKEDKEAEALTRFQENFAHFPWLIDTLEAYERQDTNEALYVRAMDKYVALTIRIMDDGEFYQTSGITEAIFERNLVTHRQKAHLHPGVGEYYERIRAEFLARPELFAK